MLRWLMPVVVVVLASPARAEGPARPAGKLAPLVKVLAATEDVEVQRDVLRGMHQALQGRRAVAAPAGWSAVYRKLSASKDAEVREKALVLSVLFGDPLALAELRKTAADAKAPEATRRTALQTLVEKRAEGTVALLRELLADRKLRGQAIRGLATFDYPQTPALLLKQYGGLTAPEKADAVATLASRPAYALALLDALERKQFSRADVPAHAARQLLALKDKRVTDKLNKVWGSTRPTSADKQKLLTGYLALVTPVKLKKADRARGRLVFARSCASCHKLFDEGGTLGPDLTGGQRANPEYVLSKVLDPSAVVALDYQVTIVTTGTGRIISGIVKAENERVLTIQTPTETVRLAKSDLEDRQKTTQSIMPEGQLAALSQAEVRDLIAYLAGPGQVPLPPSPKGGKP